MSDYFVSGAASNGYVVGNDANAGTAKGTAFLTVGKALSVVADGDTITINDGTYAEALFTVGKNITLQAENTRLAILQGSNANRTLLWNPTAGGTNSLVGLVIDGTSASAYGLEGSNVTGTFNITNCELKNGTTGGGVLKGVGSTYNITNLKLSDTSPTYGIQHSTLTTGTVIIDGLEIALTNITANIGGAVYMQATANTATVSVRNVTGTQTNAASANAGVLTFYNIGTLLVEGTCGPGGFGGPDPGFTLAGGASATTAALVKVVPYNTISTKNPIIKGVRGTQLAGSGYLVLIGTDGSGGATTDGMITDPIVTDCDLLGNTGSSGMHGVLIGSQIGGVVTHNRIRGVAIPIIFKLDNTRSGLAFCNDTELGYNGGTNGHLYSKGCAHGTVFACNKIHMQSGYMLKAFYVTRDATAPTLDAGTRFIGNNVYSDTNVASMASVGASGDASTATFALNNYSIPSVSGTPWSYGTGPTTYNSLSAWGAAQETTYRTKVPGAIDPTYFKGSFAPFARIALLERCGDYIASRAMTLGI